MLQFRVMLHSFHTKQVLMIIAIKTGGFSHIITHFVKKVDLLVTLYAVDINMVVLEIWLRQDKTVNNGRHSLLCKVSGCCQQVQSLVLMVSAIISCHYFSRLLILLLVSSSSTPNHISLQREISKVLS